MQRRIMHWLIGYPLGKGAILGFVTVAVVQSGLSPFAQALIIALTSALIGALGMIAAAALSARSANDILERQKYLAAQLEDVKGAIGATKRQKDPTTPEKDC